MDTRVTFAYLGEGITNTYAKGEQVCCVID